MVKRLHVDSYNLAVRHQFCNGQSFHVIHDDWIKARFARTTRMRNNYFRLETPDCIFDFFTQNTVSGPIYCWFARGQKNKPSHLSHIFEDFSLAMFATDKSDGDAINHLSSRNG